MATTAVRIRTKYTFDILDPEQHGKPPSGPNFISEDLPIEFAFNDQRLRKYVIYQANRVEAVGEQVGRLVHPWRDYGKGCLVIMETWNFHRRFAVSRESAYLQDHETE